MKNLNEIMEKDDFLIICEEEKLNKLKENLVYLRKFSFNKFKNKISYASINSLKYFLKKEGEIRFSKDMIVQL